MGGVFLGMPGPWAGHMHEAADHYTTKIGGIPDWPIPLPSKHVDLFKCSACKSNLSHLAQVYAPISKENLNIEERVIYVFGCLKPECGSATVSWRAIRIQKSVNSEGLKSQSDKAVSLLASSISDPEKEQKKDLEEDDDDDDDDDDIDLAELGRALSEAASLASQSKKQNRGRKLTAKTSSPVCAARVIDKKLPVIPCFYIYAEEEKFSKKDASVCSKNILSPIKDLENDPDTREETWEVEDYEYDRALNADRVYLKFKKRVDAYPEQCFRNVDELQFYLQKANEPKKDCFPLIWWRDNAKQFPVLARLARDVLNVPISTIASESAFSQARQQLGDTRHSLGSNALEVLVCFRDWIRSERRNQGRDDNNLDDPEDEEIGEILASGGPSDVAIGPTPHIDIEELTKMVQNM